MGYNSVIVVLNDGLGEIEKHPDEFVHGMVQEILLSHRPHNPNKGSFGAGNHANCGQVVSCDHADAVQVVLVGGNYGELLSSQYSMGHHESKEDKLKALRGAAEKLGYTLRKMSKKAKDMI